MLIPGENGVTVCTTCTHNSIFIDDFCNFSSPGKRNAFLLVLHNLTSCAMYCRPIHVGDDHNHNSSAGSVLKIDDTDLSECTNLNFLFNTCSGNSFDSMLKSMLYICSTLGTVFF